MRSTNPTAVSAASSGPPAGRISLHADRQLRGPAARAWRVAAGQHLPGQQAARGAGQRAGTCPRWSARSTSRWAWPWMDPRLAIGTRKEVWFLRNAPDIAPQVEPVGQHDACFLPRSSHVTGDIGIHEIAWAGDELWIVSTRFSCLATLSPDYSFVPRWRPPFISALAAEDRCHLNGLAMVDGQPKYVTALGTTDTRDGWRADKPHGGCIIDIPVGRVRHPRPVDAPFAALARRPALGARIGHGRRRARRSGHRPARNGRDAPRLHPRLGHRRPLCLRRPLQNPPHLRDGRSADRRAARRAEVRRGSGGPESRPTGRTARVPDRRGGNLRRATLARHPLPRSGRISERIAAPYVHHPARTDR